MFMNQATADVITAHMQQQQAQEVYVDLIPLTYSGAVPAPAPACTDPTPDEQHRQAMALKHDALKQKEDAHQQQQQLAQEEAQVARQRAAAAEGGESIRQQLTAGASGVFAGLRSAVSQAAMTIEKSATDVSVRTEAQVRQLEYQHNCDRFRLHFAELAEKGEVLLADYSCSAMHGGLQVNGHIQITRHYLCFFAETSSSIAKATEAVMGIFASARQAASSTASAAANAEQPQRLVGIKQVVPLSTVACIQPSVALETVGSEAPFFLPLPASTVRATALQVYATTDNRLYQFLNFESIVSRASGALSDSVRGTALDRAFNYLDHAWRESVEVPLKNVEYA